MRIKVKSLQGDEYQVNVRNDELVSSLKDRISEQAQGLPANRQKLVYKGRTMQDSSALGEYTLEDDCKIYLIVQKDAPASSASKPNMPSSSSPFPSSSSSSNPTNAAADPHRGGPPSRFEVILRERLAQYFDGNTIETIMINLQNEINQDIVSAPLDDLERLAKQKLNISNE